MLYSMSMDLAGIGRFARVLAFLSILLLILVLIPGVGVSVGGARRWFRIGNALSFQPSEFAKIAIFIYLAELLSRKEKYVKSFIHGYLPPVLALGLVLGLILLEPDLGTAIAISVVGLIMLFVSGIKVKYILVDLILTNQSINLPFLIVQENN